MGDSIDSWLSSLPTSFLHIHHITHTLSLTLPHSLPLLLAIATRKTSQDSLKASPQQSPDGIATIHETTISSSGEHSHSPEPSVTTEINRSHDHHHHHGNLHRTHSDLLKKRPEIYVSTSTGDSDEERWETKGCSAPAPPPIPPKRGLGKMVSLPQAASASRGAGGHGLPADAGGDY